MSVHIEYEPNPVTYDRYGRAWVEALTDLVSDALAGQDGASVLDVGCGRGELLRALSSRGLACSGVDFDETCVAIAGQWGDTQQSSIEELPDRFGDDSFDLVVLSHVLEHTHDPGAAIAVLRRITRRYIALAVPNLASSTSFFQAARHAPRYVNQGHRQGWDPNHLLTFLECTCDLEVVRWGSDRVLVPTVLGVLLDKVGLSDLVERRLLTRVVPRLSNSLIVLCEKTK